MARGTIQYAASGKFASTGVDDNGDATTLTIDANENLGIGGVSPIGTHSTLTSVRVGGNAIINHTTASAASGSLDITQNANYDTDGSWEYIVTDEVSRYQQSGGEHIFSAAASGTAGNDITWVEALRIKADGNVGIGTTNPTPGLGGSDVTLEIAGATSPSLTINDTGQAEKYSLYADSDDIKIAYGSTILATFQNDGNVGIGTTSPANPLHIETAGNTGIQIRSGTTTSNGFINFNDGATAKGQIFYDHNGDYMRLYVNAAERLRIDSSGNVGIGTSNPDQLLVVSDTGNSVLKLEAYTTTAAQGPNLVLARSNNGTLGAQTAVDAEDLLGGVYFQGSSGTAFASGPNILAYADETWSGTASGSTLRFYTVDNTTTTADERMRIDHNGNVGIGTTAPETSLHVGNTASGTAGVVGKPVVVASTLATVYDGTSSGSWQGLKVSNSDGTTNRTATGITFDHRTAGSGVAAIVSTSAAADRADLRFITRDGTGISERMKIGDDGKLFSLPTYNNTSSGGANVYILSGTGELHRSTSSRRYKTNIVDSAKGLNELLTLRPVDFNSLCTSDDPNKPRTGFIAEEVAEAGFEEYAVRDENNDIQNVEYGHMVALCVKAIQELSAKNDALETKIKTLESNK